MRVGEIGTIEMAVPAKVSTAQETTGTDKSFSQTLADALKDVNQMQLDSETATVQLAAGQAELHQVMIAAEKADISLQLTVAIRNKILDAYNEIMRMQV